MCREVGRRTRSDRGRMEVRRTGDHRDAFRHAEVTCSLAGQPADDIDPAYGRALREAADAGVELLAYSTAVEPARIELAERLPIEL